MRAPDWLTARPVAHRGLHDRARGIIENMPGAFAAAIAGNFAIESTCSSPPTAKPWCITTMRSAASPKARARCWARPRPNSRQVAFKDTAERMMSLGDLCALVDGPRAAGDRGEEPF